MANDPITGLPYQEAGSKQTDALQNGELNYFGVWVNPVVLAVGQAAPTGSEVDGDRYIVGVGTGLFAGWDNRMAVKRSGAWASYVPLAAGVPLVKNLYDGEDYEYVGSAWTVKGGGGGAVTTTELVTEASAFTAVAVDHAGTARLVLAGGDVTFDNAETYAAGDTFNVRATAGIELIEDGVTLTPPAGGTLELDARMSVTVVMTGATTGLVIGQTVPL